MAKEVTKDAYLKLDVGGGNEIDVSDNMTSLNCPESCAVQDTTTFGETGETKKGGLTNWAVTAVLKQNYTASGMGSKIKAMLGTSVDIEFMPKGSVVAGTNPKFSGEAVVESYQPVSSTHGTVPEFTLTLAGSGTLTRTEA